MLMPVPMPMPMPMPMFRSNREEARNECERTAQTSTGRRLRKVRLAGGRVRMSATCGVCLREIRAYVRLLLPNLKDAISAGVSATSVMQRTGDRPRVRWWIGGWVGR